MEEFEKLVAESFESDLLPGESEPSDVTSGRALEPDEAVISEESAVQHQDSEPAQTAEDSELATVEHHHPGKSNPAA